MKTKTVERLLKELEAKPWHWKLKQHWLTRIFVWRCKLRKVWDQLLGRRK